MSTLSYAALTTKREKATPGTSTSNESQGLRTYIDAFAALVPAEVLTLHALIISATTSSTVTQGTIIPNENLGTLKWSFYGLLVVSIILYVAGRIKNGSWDSFDYLRALIPPLAFVGWTMLQRVTAFDAISKLQDAPRTVIALFLGLLLGLAATALAFKADQKTS